MLGFSEYTDTESMKHYLSFLINDPQAACYVDFIYCNTTKNNPMKYNVNKIQK